MRADRELTPLERRVQLTEQLRQEWLGRPFSWKDQVTCVRLVAAHLRRMGYTPPLAKAGSFKTARGALGALRRAGFASLADGLDSLGFPRIAPAAAIVGDIVELPGEAPFNSLNIALGNGALLGFHEDAEGVTIVRASEFVTAWRVDPLSK